MTQARKPLRLAVIAGDRISCNLGQEEYQPYPVGREARVALSIPRQDKTLAALEKDAKAKREGLWADSSPVPPWEWRNRKRERTSK